MSIDDPTGDMTQWSTVLPLISDTPGYVPVLESERIAAYQKYEEIYWGHPEAFRLTMRGAVENPIYVPNAMTVCDSTAHFLLKGLRIYTGEGESDNPQQKLLTDFLNREMFYPEFHIAKHSGVYRGDYVFHLVADKSKDAGSRVSIKSVDPASYFPIRDEDDPDRILGVDLIEQVLCDDFRTRIMRQRYQFVTVSSQRRVLSEQAIYEPQDWWKDADDESGGAELYETVIKPRLLEPEITQIPVYHFVNRKTQGDPFGSSELRGHERLLASINQAVSDEEVALALEGLGVYATDAPPPTNDLGEELPWTISPARVLEIPAGTNFKRVEGVGSVKPMQDHIQYLQEAMYEATATFRPQEIDVALAESNIGMAIRFMPTLAKLEMRDILGVGKLKQMFHDLHTMWWPAYEGKTLGKGQEIKVEIGDKLPEDREGKLNELNNMLDRKIISRKFYRAQMKKFGYEIPGDIEKEILEEEEALAESRVFTANGGGDPTQKGTQPPNNADRPNQSSGTTAANGTRSAQQRRTDRQSRRQQLSQ